MQIPLCKDAKHEWWVAPIYKIKDEKSYEKYIPQNLIQMLCFAMAEIFLKKADTTKLNRIMRKQPEQLSGKLILFKDHEKPVHYICYASELIERLDVSEEELDLAIERAFKACASLDISIKLNFKSVFRTCEDHLVTDWRLTALACYLIVINADPSNSKVARMQIHFATKNFSDMSFF